MGIAVAEHADQASQPSLQAASPISTLLGQAERVIEELGKASRQLKSALHAAEKAEDQLLVTCLGAKREALEALRTRAILQFRALETATSVDAGRRSYGEITAIAQSANVVGEEASRCVGGDQREPGFSLVVVTKPEPDSDLYAPIEGGNLAPGAGSSIPVVVPPPLGAGTTDNAATGDMPNDMPSMPDVASPMR